MCPAGSILTALAGRMSWRKHTASDERGGFDERLFLEYVDQVG
jgi:hypothetical protein